MSDAPNHDIDVHGRAARGPRQAVLLAGGLGTRLGAVTRCLPKPLLPVQGVPVIERLIDRLREAGVVECTVVTCHRAAEVEAHLGAGRDLGVRIDFLREPAPLGTAGCLGLLRRPDRPFFLVNADIVTDLCFRALAERHAIEGATATVAVRPHAVPIEYGVVEFDSGGLMRSYREKPVHEAIIGMGIYCLDPRVCDHVLPGEAVSMPDVLARLLAVGARVFCHRDEGVWRDIGRQQDYDACQQILLPAVRSRSASRAA
ncbi:MAG: sugar phosphate nucleotidyltransferase [Planctomycetota bacterium]